MGESFAERLDAFVAIAQEVSDAKYARDPFYGENYTPPRYSIDPKGLKYVRIVRDEVSQAYGRGHLDARRSVHCFVEKATGNVLKAGGWKAPTPGELGNIWDDDGGRSAFTAEGSRRRRASRARMRAKNRGGGGEGGSG